jgi:NAD(P)-dependent dehydrogenase (short-subunit alcohol dehydrogenase family)
MLDGKVAVVTGAGQGIGEGIARRFAAEGAVVVCADMDDPTPVAESLPPHAAGRESRAVEVDIADVDGVDALIADTIERFGRLDVLVNNAGTGYPIGPLLDADDEPVRRTIEVNILGTFFMSRAAGRVMREQGAGRIVNIASQYGKLAAANFGPYSASKAAVISLTQSLALELGQYGITVNAILPGTISTPAMYTLAQMFHGEDVDFDAYLEDYAKETIPVGRVGQPADVAAMAAWLATDDASFTTGAALNVTGGEAVYF